MIVLSETSRFLHCRFYFHCFKLSDIFKQTLVNSDEQNVIFTMDKESHLSLRKFSIIKTESIRIKSKIRLDFVFSCWSFSSEGLQFIFAVLTSDLLISAFSLSFSLSFMQKHQEQSSICYFKSSQINQIFSCDVFCGWIQIFDINHEIKNVFQDFS